jgi:hypothetical protein
VRVRASFECLHRVELSWGIQTSFKYCYGLLFTAGVRFAATVKGGYRTLPVPVGPETLPGPFGKSTEITVPVRPLHSLSRSKPEISHDSK